MKIAVFGGAGDMGSEAVRDLASNPEVTRVVIADANERAAEKLASELGDKVEAVGVDAHDHDEVTQLMKVVDASLSCVGPFYTYEERMIRAAIEAKTSYVSICDDFDAAEKALAMNAEAKKAGITVLTGMGWSPGISNVLARKAMETMDSVRRVNVTWAGSVDDAKGLAIIKHTLFMFTGMAPAYIDGKWKKIRSGGGKEVVEFPAPIGAIPVYYVSHPEPVTLPHFMTGLDEVTVKGGMAPVWFNDLAVFLGRVGLTTTSARRDVVAGAIHKLKPLLSALGESPGLSGIRVDVYGEKKGKRTHHVYSAVDRMKRLTGISASIGTMMVATGRIKEKGVVAPEVCIKPGEFIKELIKRSVRINIDEKQ